MKKLIFILMLALPLPLFAFVGYVGGGLGVSDITVEPLGGSNISSDLYDPSFSVSPHVGFIFADHFGVGFSLGTWLKSKEDSLGNEYSLSVIPLMFEGNYYPMDGATGLYFGVTLAGVLENTTVKISNLETSDSDLEFGFGGQVGWNINLTQSQKHSIGIEARYLHVAGSPQDYQFISGLVFYNFWWGKDGIVTKLEE